MSEKTCFRKPVLSLEEQVALLISRGMAVKNEENAKSFLRDVNYYRFSGYAIYYEIFQNGQRTHVFKPGTEFEKVKNIYWFDSELRSILFQAIEPIEIAFRTAVCIEASLFYNDSHWYGLNDIFDHRFDKNDFFDLCNKEIQQSHEIFVKKYKEKYSSPELLPCWMLTEIISLGRWSRIYGSLKERIIRKRVSDRFDCSEKELKSWMHGLTMLRNLCAHHSRVWNRNFSIMISVRDDWMKFVENIDKIAVYFPLLIHLHNTLSDNYGIQNVFDEFLNNYKGEVDLKIMGFKEQGVS
ncbi:MAG TPA: Abi family protein [bacterium]|nr:Abi family protein [bacterium]